VFAECFTSPVSRCSRPCSHGRCARRARRPSHPCVPRQVRGPSLLRAAAHPLRRFVMWGCGRLATTDFTLAVRLIRCRTVRAFQSGPVGTCNNGNHGEARVASLACIPAGRCLSQAHPPRVLRRRLSRARGAWWGPACAWGHSVRCPVVASSRGASATARSQRTARTPCGTCSGWHAGALQ
jgi:hypothetical protein